jgi:hypothetical protein
MSTINSYSEFQPLEEVVVGQGYPAAYFDHIDDSEVRDNLQKIFTEIEEDFQYLIKTLESCGVVVQRPGICSKDEFQTPALAENCMSSPLPPLTPRDRQGVLGNKLVRLSNYEIFQGLFDYYKSVDPANVVDVFEQPGQHVIDGANNSCVFRMGRDIWFDESDYLTAAQSQWLEQNILIDSQYRFHRMLTDGHGDCVFAVLKPGVIITSYHDSGVNYQDFPTSDIHRINTSSMERQSYQQGFWNFRNNHHPGQNWWVPGIDNLPRFKSYVDQYLNNWVGAVHESVFDVNCLSIDENRVIFGCYDKGVFDYCKQHGIEPILCDIRHRFFFDGSVHCCTLDIRRKGGMEDYYG